MDVSSEPVAISWPKKAHNNLNYLNNNSYNKDDCRNDNDDKMSNEKKEL